MEVVFIWCMIIVFFYCDFWLCCDYEEIFDVDDLGYI